MRKIWAVSLLSLVTVACGDSPTAPSAPSAPVSIAAETPAAKVIGVGTLYVYPTYRLSPDTPRYVIEGVGQNVTGSCLANISGVTTVEGTVTGSWRLHPSNVVTAGSQFWYRVEMEVPTSVWANPAPVRHVVNYTTAFEAGKCN